METTDYISRQAAKRLIADIQLGESPKDAPCTVYQSGIHEGLNIAFGAIVTMRSAEVRNVVFCKDCIHRPYETVPGVRYGLTVESPDREYKCPCFCDGDGWYSWIPDDDFFCANGERREGGTP